jgi:hypothetical protein
VKKFLFEIRGIKLFLSLIKYKLLTSWRWVVSFMLQLLVGKDPQCQLGWRLCWSQKLAWNLWRREKCLLLLGTASLFLGYPAPGIVSMLTELSRHIPFAAN